MCRVWWRKISPLPLFLRVQKDRRPKPKEEEGFEPHTQDTTTKMSTFFTSFSLLIIILLLLNLAAIVVFSSDGYTYTRDDFPPSPSFVFGSGTSAYQVEGAANEDGRSPSIWDTFTHAGHSKGATGDVTSDQYHKYKEDVQLMVETGLEAYRFSISWSRLIPNGKGPVNPKGVQYYNNLINELISHGIQPHVTIHHSDFPQALEDEYGGWVSRKIVEDFTVYADVCYREFGDRVLHWTTMNEANIFIQAAYDMGIQPPLRCSPPFGRFNCSKGNSSTEPYMATHHILLAHASAARLYKKKYQGKQHGFIGINIFAFYLVPFTNTTKDVIATQRANDFFLGWYMNPLVYGDYPEIMKKNAGSRIPAFTTHESEQVKGSFDFLALNHYSPLYIKDNSRSLETDRRDYLTDMEVELTYVTDDTAAHEFLNPWSLQGVLEYFKQVYGNPPIYIHENGLSTPRSSSLMDTPRVEYMQAYIGSLLDAVRNGSNARGYFTWSFIDVFELLDGLKSSYGLYYVDLDDPELKRYPKLSQHWYSNFLKGQNNSSNEFFGVMNNNISAKSPAHLSQ